MKRYVYYILTAILFMTAVAGAKAQTLKITVDKTSGEYDMISYDGSYHVVKGTKVKVSLDVTPPSGRIIIDNNTQWEYDSPVQYRKGDSSLNGPTDEFTLTQDTEITYSALYSYKIYTYNTTSNSWITDGKSYFDGTTNNVTIKFKAYNNPAITNLQLTPQNKKTYVGAGSTSFTVGNLTNNDGLEIEVNWQDNNNTIQNNHSNIYTFNPSSEGDHTIKATVNVNAPNGNPWWTSAQLTSKINVLPAPSSVVPTNAITALARKYSYVGQNVSYQYAVTALDNRYQWKCTWTFNGVEKEGNSATFANPSTANTYPVKLSVQAYNPDDANDPWGNPVEYTTSVEVLPAPSSVVSTNNLQNAITVPSRKYSYVGQDVSYQYAVTALDKRYQWVYTWTFNGENKTGTSATFDNPSVYGTYPATLSVQAYNPVDENEAWGQPITCSTKNEDIITVLPAPSSVVSTNNLQNAITVPSRKYSYVGQKDNNGNDVKYTFSVNLSGISGFNEYKWKYTWTFNTKNETGTSATFDNPTVDGTYPATLSVQAYNPVDENEAWGQPITCSTKNEDIITVLPAPSSVVSSNNLQNAITTPTRKYSYVGQPDITYQYAVTALDNRYQWEYTWTFNGENKTGYSATFASPSAANTYSATLSVQAKSPDGSEVWGQPITCQTKDKDIITVLPAPSSVVSSNNLQNAIIVPTRKYSYLGQSNVTYQYAVTALDNRYQWVYTWTFNGENKTGASAQFNNPTAVNTYSATLSAQAKSPDGSEVWGQPITCSTKNEDVITVLPAPSSVVSSNTLQNDITVPTSKYSYVGQPNITYQYAVAALKGPYQWEYTWTFNGENKTGYSATFANPSAADTYSATLSAQAKSPDGSEVWEKITCTTKNEDKITVYLAPQYTQKGCHENSQDDAEHKFEYSTFKDVKFDAGNLFNIKDSRGVLTGNPNGWIKELYVAIEGDTEKKMPDLSFTPTEANDYSLRLVVKNVAPSGDEWYKNSDDDNGMKYTLRVYNIPIWTTNIKNVFGVEDNDPYKDLTNLELHVQSGVNVPFEISSDGSTPLNVGMTIEGTTESFNYDGSKYTNTWSKNNESDTKADYPFSVNISSNIDYLVKGLDSYEKKISGKIIVWKEITADFNMPELATDIEGNYILEKWEDEGENQVIKLNLTGGKPNLQNWIVNVIPDANCPTGTYHLNGHEYTYVIKGSDLKSGDNASKTYRYTIKMYYQEGEQMKTEVVTKSINIIVWPKPEITPKELALDNNGTVIKYKGKLSGNGYEYNLICYKDDELLLDVTPSEGSNDWKYKINDGELQILPNNNQIPISKDLSGVVEIHFYNKLGTNDVEVLTLKATITRCVKPSEADITINWPTVDNTGEIDWTNAEVKAGKTTIPVDLYGDGETHNVVFKFTGGGDYTDGWDYVISGDGKSGSISQTQNKADWKYTVIKNTGSSKINQDISLTIKHSIRNKNNQEDPYAENVGLEVKKTYRICAWPKAELPTDYNIEDGLNSSNNIKSTRAIREGNLLRARVNKTISGGYNKDDGYRHYFYKWKGDGAQSNEDKSTWDAVKVSKGGSHDKTGHSTPITYGLRVYNTGPRGTIWADKTFDDCDVYVYNRPETPSSLVIKGKGTSGTMIVTYGGISDTQLINSEEYVIAVHYTDASGNSDEKHKAQGGDGDIRWVSGLSNVSGMTNVYAYSFWYDKNVATGEDMLITSGRIALNGDIFNDGAKWGEDWDHSLYALSADEKEAIKAITRAGGGIFTDIQSVTSDEMRVGLMSVYNINGMMLGTSTEGLKPGIYIIRYQQDGEQKSRKVSVK